MSQHHFSIPIPPCGEHAGGGITCTEPQPAVYVLTWVSPPENRTTTAFLHALLTALDVIEFGDYSRGVVITTSGIAKYYSNGADLEHAYQTKEFWQLFLGDAPDQLPKDAPGRASPGFYYTLGCGKQVSPKIYISPSYFCKSDTEVLARLRKFFETRRKDGMMDSYEKAILDIL